MCQRGRFPASKWLIGEGRVVTDRLHQILLDVAHEVEADELRLKHAIRDAARAGDCNTVLALIEGWLTSPPAEVLAHALITAGEIR